MDWRCLISAVAHGDRLCHALLIKCAQLMLWQNGRSLGHLSADMKRDNEEHCEEKVQGSLPDSDNSGQWSIAFQFNP
jgi:hypothetical protein